MRAASRCHSLRRSPRTAFIISAGPVLAVLLCSVAAWAQGSVTITSPKADPAKPGEPPLIRGIQTLSATKPNAGEGWVSIVLTKGPGISEPQFLAAVISPYKYKWDTRVRTKGKRVYPDGDYTLQFSAHRPTGDSLGMETITASLKNDIAPEDIGTDPIELRHQFTPRDRIRYEVTCESTLQLPAQLRPLEKVLGSMESNLDVTYTSAIMDVGAVSPDFPDEIEATIRNTPREGIYEAKTMPPQLFPGLGRSHTVKQRANGVIRPLRPELGRFGFGELYVQLPAGPVKLGQRWPGEASVMPEYGTGQRLIVPAQHALEGFEWLQGQKCARIHSTYNYNGYVTVVVEGAGITCLTSMQGERATYFAYEIGQVLLMEESNQHTLQVDLAQVGKRPESGGDEDEDEEEEEEEEEEDEDADAGGHWYAHAPGDLRVTRAAAPMPWDEGSVLFAGVAGHPTEGDVYLTQARPTVPVPRGGRPTAGAAPRGPRVGAQPGGAAAAAAAASALVVPVPYNVKIRIERPEPPAPAVSVTASTGVRAAGPCPQGGAHVAGPPDANGRIHCTKCGQFI